MERNPICDYCIGSGSNSKRKLLRLRFKNYRRTLKCESCEETQHYLLTFHHRDRTTKEDTITHLVEISSTNKLKEELKKCSVLCLNCHKELHYKEDHPEEFPKEVNYEELVRNKIFYSLTRASKSYIFRLKELEKETYVKRT